MLDRFRYSSVTRGGSKPPLDESLPISPERNFLALAILPIVKVTPALTGDFIGQASTRVDG
jgi:hypothetical protein